MASPTPLLSVTVGEMLLRSTEEVPNQELFVFRHQDIRKTFCEVLQDSRNLAKGLLKLGLRPGDRVGMWGPNYYEWVTTQFATALAGMILVNVNPMYQTEELEYALRQVGVKALITPAEYRNSNYYRALSEVVPQLAREKEGIGLVHDNMLPQLKHLIIFGNEGRQFRGAWNFTDIVASGGKDEEELLEDLSRKISFDQPVNIQYTSGTTGFPKAATLSHHNVVNNAFFVGKRTGFDKKRSLELHGHSSFWWERRGGATGGPLPEDFLRPARQHTGTTGFPKAATLSHHNVVNNAFFVGKRTGFDKKRHVICIPNPLYHCFGCVMGTLAAVVHKATCVFPSPAFNAEKAIEAIEQEKCTVLYGTPTMHIDILGHPRRKDSDVSSLHVGYISGAPCPKSLCESLVTEMNLHDLVVLYGSTELSPVATCSFFEDPPFERIKNVGYGPLGGYGSRRLGLRGSQGAAGSAQDSERSHEAITPERWYNTGDTAVMNENGSINIVGRLKDMVIRGGENIYPAEVEQFLFKHHAVADVHIVGVPDERFGEELCAWVRLKDGHDAVTAEAIKEFCRGKIAACKIPRYVLFKKEHEFPLTATGKVRKAELRELSKKELGLQQIQSSFN
uniref:Medium-chain acyl-CoA ligase ACSF2, mitochondrial n=1 Tax=Steinernema glaseri TaxID=37863 RepID=A0A1I7Y9G1_9BILA